MIWKHQQRQLWICFFVAKLDMIFLLLMAMFRIKITDLQNYRLNNYYNLYRIFSGNGIDAVFAMKCQ